MTSPRLTELRSIDDLARVVRMPVSELERYANTLPQSSFYDTLRIPKRGRRRAGQFRTVMRARSETLSDLHRAIALLVSASTAFGPHVQGFLQDRSIVTNARQHLGRRLVLHADIENFFDSVTREQVERGFVALGTAAPVAALLARLCTIDGRLGQGTRCAPVIANLVCLPLDAALLALAGAQGATYTRYADDLTFSGDAVPSSEAVAAVLVQHGFQLRDGRCYVQRRGRAQFVTGLQVGSADGPRLSRRLKRRLRLVLHYIEEHGMDGHFARQAPRPVAADPLALAGLLRYAQSVEPRLIYKLRAQYQAGSRKSALEREQAREEADHLMDAMDPDEA